MFLHPPSPNPNDKYKPGLTLGNAEMLNVFQSHTAKERLPESNSIIAFYFQM